MRECSFNSPRSDTFLFAVNINDIVGDLFHSLIRWTFIKESPMWISMHFNEIFEFVMNASKSGSLI